MTCKRNNNLLGKNFPGTIRELLKLLCGEKVTIVLDAEDEPEHVEIEAVIGDLLVAETCDHKFKFVDIDCICAVIIDRENLLEGIFQCDDEEEESIRKERTASGRNQENGVAGMTNNYQNTPTTRLSRY